MQKLIRLLPTETQLEILSQILKSYDELELSDFAKDMESFFESLKKVF